MKAITERELKYLEQLEGQRDGPLLLREECGGKKYHNLIYVYSLLQKFMVYINL